MRKAIVTGAALFITAFGGVAAFGAAAAAPAGPAPAVEVK